jgi:hypothetical protein
MVIWFWFCNLRWCSKTSEPTPDGVNTTKNLNTAANKRLGAVNKQTGRAVDEAQLEDDGLAGEQEESARVRRISLVLLGEDVQQLRNLDDDDDNNNSNK